MTTTETERRAATMLEPIDPKVLRRCLAQFATGVTIVTTQAGGRIAGTTANSFASVSLDPPLVLFSATLTSNTLPVLLEGTHFTVNVLALEQMALANRFAKSNIDRFEGVDWQPGLGGAPVLAGVAGVLECRREADYPGGDHRIIVGRVERLRRFDSEPLAFAQGRYAGVMDHPETRIRSSLGEGDGRLDDEFLTSLLSKAYGTLSLAVTEPRRSVGLTVAQSRLLLTIAAVPGLTLEAYLPKLALSAASASDARASLEATGYLALDAERHLVLTEEGLDIERRLRRAIREMEARVIAGLDPAELAVTRKVLATIVRRGGNASG